MTDEQWAEMRKEAVAEYSECKESCDKNVAELNAI